MNEASETAKRELYLKKTHKVREILRVFEEYFTPELVDCDLLSEDSIKDMSLDEMINALDPRSAISILVKFPRVKIENEKDESEIIYDLFAKVPVNLEGKMITRFTLSKTTFTEAQLSSGYVHSHVPRIPASCIGVFQSPCLGSGPIQGTISTLSAEYDLDYWGLFCYELDKYVAVESLTGGPYIKMSEIGAGINLELGIMCLFNTHSKFNAMVENFIKYLVKQNVLKFTFNNGRYTLGESALKTYLKVNDVFVQYIRKKYFKESGYTIEKLIEADIISPSYIVTPLNLCLCKINLGVVQEGKELFSFKGTPQRLQIIRGGDYNQQKNMLHVEVFNYIITKLLNIINYGFRY